MKSVWVCVCTLMYVGARVWCGIFITLDVLRQGLSLNLEFAVLVSEDALVPALQH